MSEQKGQHSGSGDRGGTVGAVANEDYMVKVKTCEPRIGRTIYPMQSNPRGFCLIFNIFEFKHRDPNQNIRKGSEAEAKRLSEVFTELHFVSVIKDNPNKKDIELTIEEYAVNPILKTHDCLIVIVLSHGKSGGFIAADSLDIQFKDIVEKLNNKNCPNLINKPKLFFFSCCRGDTYDYGVEHTIQALDAMNINNSVADTLVIPQSERAIRDLVPTATDIMICYSTVDGYVSWRCEETGTWLGLALSKALLAHSHDTDLLKLLTSISHSINERKSTNESAKQVIEIILRGFKKEFYFNPGYIASASTSDASVMNQNE